MALLPHTRSPTCVEGKKGESESLQYFIFVFREIEILSIASRGAETPATVFVRQYFRYELEIISQFSFHIESLSVMYAFLTIPFPHFLLYCGVLTLAMSTISKQN